MSGKITECVSGSNGGSGMSVTAYGSVRDCIVTDNGGEGIMVDKNCQVKSNSSGNNIGGAGILLRNSGNRIVGNNLTDNKYGVRTESTATNNLVVRNTATGNSVNNYSIGDNNAFGDRRLGIGLIGLTTGPWANFSLDGRQ